MPADTSESKNSDSGLTTKAAIRRRLGLYSLIVAVGVPATWIVLYLLGAIIGTRTAVGNYLGLSALAIAMFAPVFHLVGAVLGIAGYFLNGRRGKLPIIAFAVNVLLGIAGISLIYVILKSMGGGVR